MDNIRVLIAEDDPEVAKRYARIAEAQELSAINVYTVTDAIAQISQPTRPDILLMDLSLNGGTERSDVILDLWVQRACGPVAIISNLIDEDSRANYIVSGAWNVFCDPVTPAVVQAILSRYARDIRFRRVAESMSAEMVAMKGTMKKLFILVAVLGVGVLISIINSGSVSLFESLFKLASGFF